MTGQAEVFDLRQPPPLGQLAIEASAGTGKTFTLTGLATRYLCDGLATAGQLLVVTFTRAATEELRARVRERITGAIPVLEGLLAVPEDDEFLAELCAADDELRGERAQRLRTALAEFDSATIITIHGFARQVHRTLGISPAVDPDATLVSDGKELVLQVCTDVLVDAATTVDDPGLLPSLGDLVAATTEAVRRDNIDVQPDDTQGAATPGQRFARGLVVRAAEQCATRRLRTATVGFDDLLTQLRGALADPDTGPGIVDALRSRYKVALIDEFQDTDGVQWEIFSSLFAGPGSGNVLVTVGDPKQAIYRFRGADIHTYLRAVGGASGVQRASLNVNWRSDDAVLEALDTFFDGVTFGDDAIRFQEVSAAEVHRRRRFRMGDDPEPPTLEFRVVANDDVDHLKLKGKTQYLRTDAAYAAVNADLAAHVQELLRDAEVPDKAPDSFRSVGPSDIAVLVNTNAHAEQIQRQLVDAGVPAVIAAEGDVLTSPAAGQVRILMRAMARPFDSGAVRAFALSWFSDWTPADIVERDDAAWALLEGQLATWAALLARLPVADVLTHVWSRTGVVPRVLGRRDGDRNLTDLDHVAELLHESAAHGRAAVAALLSVLETPPARGADTEIEGSVAARRIESDLDAVQIMTIWKAKGLEFPIVLVPGLWWVRDNDMTLFAEGEDDARPPGPVRWVLDVANGETWPDGEAASRRRAAADHEVAGEQLRLLYVALTRACHRTTVWWANLEKSAGTALAHVLFARQDGVFDPVSFAEPLVAVPDESEVAGVLAGLVEHSHGTIGVRILEGPTATPTEGHRTSGADGDTDRYRVAAFDRTLDRSVGRWSFSSITDQVSEADVDPFDESSADGGASDEGQPDGSPPADDPIGSSASTDPTPFVPGQLAILPAGTEFGTLVHSVLETVDFASTALEDDLALALDRALGERFVDLTPRGAPAADPVDGRRTLVSGLADAIRAPLGPGFDGGCLADLGPGDRLDELSFEFLLGRGRRSPSVRLVGDLVASHLSIGDPLRDWAVGLASGPTHLRFSGHLTGSIDLVARVERPGGERYVVADYKTNQLTARGARPTPDDYGPTALAAAMAAHHYPLQALLYSVALHRYLAWRLPGYSAGSHLGGAAYLFVRGMVPGAPAGTDAAGQPAPSGVFSWSIPPDLVTDLSALLSTAEDGASDDD